MPRPPARLLPELCIAVLLMAGLPSAGRSGAEGRILELTYAVEVAAVPESDGPVDIFLPIARSDDHQTIVDRVIETSIHGTEGVESVYGNHFWHGHLDSGPGVPIRIEVTYVVRREIDRNAQLEQPGHDMDTESERREHQLFLQPNRLVPVSGPLVEGLSAEIVPASSSPVAVARAIYDYVIDHMEYKKVGDGWGHGDTRWACTEKYGNCTDFHALFISLARFRGIPARFEIGLPVPADPPAGEIGGYHCWVQLYLPGIGWMPIDASEASKHPERRDLYFGTLPADRVLFTVGRDIELGEDQVSGPLNYFINPHVEVGGQPFADVERVFRYRELDASAGRVGDAGATGSMTEPAESVIE